jgi:L-threonylcarbamoyladenylate synthase
VVHEFGPALWVLDGGDCEVGIESAIVDCTRPPPAHPALLRPGQLSRAVLAQALGEPLSEPDAASPRASGTLASHYAPRAALSLLDDAGWQQRVEATAVQPGVALYARREPPAGWWHRPMAPEAGAAAHELFAVLRELDDAGARAIWVQAPPADAAWDGVRDRLRRAAA